MVACPPRWMPDKVRHDKATYTPAFASITTETPRAGATPSAFWYECGRLPGKASRSPVDSIVSGTHEPGTSQYELLRAFAGDPVLQRASVELLDAAGYLTHEFGDTVLINKQIRAGIFPKDV